MKEVLQISTAAIKTPRSQGITMRGGVNIGQLLTGLGVLALGTLFYYMFRSAEHTYFLKILSIHPHSSKSLAPIILTLANSLPTFIHVFAFILMTAAFVASRKRAYAIVCLAWFAIDALFELGQGFGDLIIPVIPGWFSNILFLENTGDYFLRGRFDHIDLLSIALGSVAAYVLLLKTTNDKGGPT
jgi:hypothetical protein